MCQIATDGQPDRKMATPRRRLLSDRDEPAAAPGVFDSTGATGMRIIRAIGAGARDPDALA